MIMVPLICEGRNRADPRIQMSNFIWDMHTWDDLKYTWVLKGFEHNTRQKSLELFCTAGQIADRTFLELVSLTKTTPRFYRKPLGFRKHQEDS